MHNLLNKLFAKRGIKDPRELSPEETATFENWDKILSKEELTLEDVKQFCKTQVLVIEGKWADYSTDNAKKAELLPYYTVYKTLLNAIESPKVGREALEKQLIEMIK